MSDIVKYISKVEINGMWGRFDISWDLNADVNVLSGINGSGKSTILNCVSALISTNREFAGNRSLFLIEMGKYIEYCKISLSSGDYILAEFIKKNNKERKQEFLKENHPDKYTNKIVHTGRISGASESLYEVLFAETLIPSDYPLTDIVSTFDNELKSSEAISKLSDETVKTHLDWELYHLKNKYIEYKLDIAEKTIAAINKNNSNAELIKIQDNQNKFIDIIDTIFEQTGKKINRTEKEISFLAGEEKISPYELSSGEKQILVILLTVLVQDNKNAILFMDEPEISLHFDWQKKLIQYIRELNPNVQIILATHSPAIIMEGWLDKVSNISDMIKLA